MLKGDAPLPPIAQLIGFKLTSVTCGQAVIEFQAGEQHANPMGILHGSVFCDKADAAMGIAYASTIEEGETLAALELKINFLKPIWQAKLGAVAICVGIDFGAISSVTRLPYHAARSIV
jgi:uncharacterized protein (TIGR00369 family)